MLMSEIEIITDGDRIRNSGPQIDPTWLSRDVDSVIAESEAEIDVQKVAKKLANEFERRVQELQKATG